MGTLRTDCPPQPFWHHRRHQWLKNLPANAKRRGFDPWVRKIPWRRAGQPTPVFLPGESHGQRSLAGSQPSSFRFSHHHCCGLNHPDKNGTTILDYPRPSNPAATIQFQWSFLPNLSDTLPWSTLPTLFLPWAITPPLDPYSRLNVLWVRALTPKSLTCIPWDHQMKFKIVNNTAPPLWPCRLQGKAQTPGLSDEADRCCRLSHTTLVPCGPTQWVLATVGWAAQHLKCSYFEMCFKCKTHGKFRNLSGIKNHVKYLNNFKIPILCWNNTLAILAK